MRILIADDYALFADSLTTLLEANGYQIVATVASGTEAVEAAERYRPDLALIDVAMPEMNGIEATRRIAVSVPETTIVMVSAAEDEQTLCAALEAGARGFIVKDLVPGRLLALIEATARGELALSPQMVHHALVYFSRQANHDPNALTQRQGEVLQWILQGTTSCRRLATALCVNEETAQLYVRRILDKLYLQDLQSKTLKAPPPLVASPDEHEREAC